MKTRKGFVSNSSSTSFIVAIKPPCKCPTCGMTAPDLVSYIEDKAMHDSDYRINFANREELLKSYKERNEHCQKAMDDIKHLPDAHIVSSGTNWSWSAKQQRHEMTKELEMNNNIIAQIRAIPKNLDVKQLTVSHHDEFILNAIRSSCTLIEETEG